MSEGFACRYDASICDLAATDAAIRAELVCRTRLLPQKPKAGEDLAHVLAAAAEESEGTGKIARPSLALLCRKRRFIPSLRTTAAMYW